MISWNQFTSTLQSYTPKATLKLSSPKLHFPQHLRVPIGCCNLFFETKDDPFPFLTACAKHSFLSATFPFSINITMAEEREEMIWLIRCVGHVSSWCFFSLFVLGGRT